MFPKNAITPRIPEYASFKHIVSVGSTGCGPGDFMYPEGIAINEQKGHVYVADYSSNSIQIFSYTGQYIKRFGSKHLNGPCGILIHDTNVYTTELRSDTLSMFELPNYIFEKRVGKPGDGVEEFSSPRQLDISPHQLIYVADSDNDRLQILDLKLNFKGCLKHESMTSPVDVKFTSIQMLVLSSADHLCLHMFTHSGEMLRSIISRGHGLQVEGSCYFCLDAQGNIVISDMLADAIKVFSPEGDLLHIVGDPMFTFTTGISILNQAKLVCVSQSYKYRIQIFA